MIFDDPRIDGYIKKLEQENEQLKKAVNVKNIIIKNSMESIELLKKQIEDKS